MTALRSSSLRTHLAKACCTALLVSRLYRLLLVVGGGLAFDAATKDLTAFNRPIASSTAAADGPQSPALFLFVMGIEGTGHHFFHEIYEKSPSFQRLSSWGFVRDGKYARLLRSLYHSGAPDAGLWSAPCTLKGSAVTGSGEVDGPALMNKTIASLREMDRAIRLKTQTKGHGEKPTVVAIGGFEMKIAGTMSYPTHHGPCRPLQYPDLYLLYDACRRASVTCQHMFIHRDPHAAVWSAVRRFSWKAVTQMKLEMTMLHTMQAQLLEHRESLALCWDYDVGIDDVVEASRGGGILGMGELLGWGRAEFAADYSKIHKEPTPFSAEERENFTEGGLLDPFMNSTARAMESAMETCRAIYESNQARG